MTHGLCVDAPVHTPFSGRIKRSIYVTLKVDGHKRTQDELIECDNAFATVAAIAAPAMDADTLGLKL